MVKLMLWIPNLNFTHTQVNPTWLKLQPYFLEYESSESWEYGC